MVPDVVRRHAPLVVLHRDEKLLPASAEWFVERASLRWATGDGLEGEAVSDEEQPVELHRLGAASGAQGYRHGTSTASSLTRPLDPATGRFKDLPVDQGFFLALRESSDARGIDFTSEDRSLYTGAPVYYEYDRTAKAITYWLFYAGSAPPLGILRVGEQIEMTDDDDRRSPGGIVGDLDPTVAVETLAEFVKAYPDLAPPVDDRRSFGAVVDSLKLVTHAMQTYLSDDKVLHQGDWERTTVYLDPGDPEGAEPKAIGFYMHAAHEFAQWTKITRFDETHPKIYAAIGSHASLPSPDYGHIDVGDPDGPEWRTWEGDGSLLPVADEPWYGFGGAWGRVGKVRDATGPLGPGALWKHAASRPPDVG